MDKNGASNAIGSWTGDVSAGGCGQAVTKWTVSEELTEDSKIVATAVQASGKLINLTGEAIALENISYRYLSDELSSEQGKDKLAVSAAILNNGNKTPQELTLQICSVNQDGFSIEKSTEDAYTVLSETKITKPFENDEYLSGEYQITLPKTTDGMPRELMVRVLTKDGELYDDALEYISVMPPADNVSLNGNSGGETEDNPSSGNDTDDNENTDQPSTTDDPNTANVPENKDDPIAANASYEKTESVKTGDNSNPIFWTVLLLLSLIVQSGLYAKKGKNGRHDE